MEDILPLFQLSSPPFVHLSGLLEEVIGQHLFHEINKLEMVFTTVEFPYSFLLTIQIILSCPCWTQTSDSHQSLVLCKFHPAPFTSIRFQRVREPYFVPSVAEATTPKFPFLLQM